MAGIVLVSPVLARCGHCVVVGTVLPVRPFRSLWLRQCNTKLAVELHTLRAVDEAGRMKDLPIRIPFL